MEIPSISQQHPLEAARKMLKKGIAVPYTLPLPTEETNWKVGYESPSDITLVGSWANKISVKPKDGLKYGVDMAVEMPDVRALCFIRVPFIQLTPFFVGFVPGEGLSQWAVLPEAGILLVCYRCCYQVLEENKRGYVLRITLWEPSVNKLGPCTTKRYACPIAILFQL